MRIFVVIVVIAVPLVDAGKIIDTIFAENLTKASVSVCVQLYLVIQRADSVEKVPGFCTPSNTPMRVLS